MERRARRARAPATELREEAPALLERLAAVVRDLDPRTRGAVERIASAVARGSALIKVVRLPREPPAAEPDPPGLPHDGGSM